MSQIVCLTSAFPPLFRFPFRQPCQPVGEEPSCQFCNRDTFPVGCVFHCLQLFGFQPEFHPSFHGSTDSTVSCVGRQPFSMPRGMCSKRLLARSILFGAGRRPGKSRRGSASTLTVFLFVRLRSSVRALPLHMGPPNRSLLA